VDDHKKAGFMVICLHAFTVNDHSKKYVVFHKHENVANIDCSRKLTQYPTYVDDVTPVSISSGVATDGRAMLEIVPGNVTDDTLVDGGLYKAEQSPEVVADPPVRKNTRDCQPSARYFSSEYILLTDEGELESFEEVRSHKDKQCWIYAMEDEMNSLKKNDNYDLVELPKGMKTLITSGCSN